MVHTTKNEMVTKNIKANKTSLKTRIYQYS